MSSQTDKGLTPKRERFAQLVASGMQQADAYRTAFDTKKAKDTTVHQEASRLAANPHVAARISELTAQAAAEARAAVRYELQDAMREADKAFALAMKKENATAMARVVALKAQLNGLMVEDRKNLRRPYEDMGDDQLDRAIAEKTREAGLVH